MPNNPEISIILASLRLDMAKKCIKRIYDTTLGIDYEIILVTPLEVNLDDFNSNISHRLRYIKEPKKDSQHKAIELGWKSAKGKYLFVLADDQLLQTDCILNMVKQMRLHDNELYMTGARTSNLWGKEPDQTIYGIYYPCNSCIKKSDVEKIGYFYDTSYTKYCGDPDLALKIVNMGGKVEPCFNAWLSNYNVIDNLDKSNKINYWQKDYETFFNRWHNIFGKGIERKPEIVNKGINLPSNETPNELCFRIIKKLNEKDWRQADRELASNIAYDENYLEDLFGFILMNLGWTPLYTKNGNLYFQSELFTWLLPKLVDKPVLLPLKFREVFTKQDQITNKMMRNLLIASYFIFFINRFKKVSRKINILENYKNTDVYYEGGKFCSNTVISSSLTDLIKQIDDKDSSTPPIDYLELQVLELSLNIKINNRKELIKYLFSFIDYFCNRDIEERRLNQDCGLYWKLFEERIK